MTFTFISPCLAIVSLFLWIRIIDCGSFQKRRLLSSGHLTFAVFSRSWGRGRLLALIHRSLPPESFLLSFLSFFTVDQTKFLIKFQPEHKYLVVELCTRNLVC